MNIPQLIQRAVAYDRGDARRIQHFLKVYTYADLIGRLEQLPAETQEILTVAAVLHDIGIHAAEEKYGSPSGKYQELEGPAIAKEILDQMQCPPALTERVCWLIAHHHTYTGVDGADYQILLEADFLVNAYEDSLDKKAITTFRDKIFRTKSGIDCLNTTFALS